MSGASANLRGGWALVKATWASWMEHRGFFYLVAFSWMIPLLIYMFIWSTAAGEGTVGGLTRGDLASYYVVLILVNQLTFSTNNWTVGDAIRYGRFNFLLLRPLSPVYDALASEVAVKVVFMTFALPLAAILALLLRARFDLSLANSLAFLPALLLAWALRWLWGYWLALLSFWATRADALLSLQESLIFLLAGQVAPVVLLPGPMQAAATILPFRYMVSFPVEILTGQLSSSDLGIGFALQVGWLFVALALFVVLWRAGLRRYSAVGG
ncbi:MAG: ABC-2 family transporter protein [Anaerolineae bacterium]|nr:ABC-2 family transporter protein [Anaerolineae bacterium]